MDRSLSSLTSNEFMEFVRGRIDCDKGNPFDAHESDLWRWGFEYRVEEQRNKKRIDQCH